MTRLEWTDAPDFGVQAKAGVLLLNAWPLSHTTGGPGFCWNVLAQNIDGNTSEDFNTVATIDTPIGQGLPTLADAQAAAEEAALSLLVEALAVLAPASDSDGYAAGEFVRAAGADRCMGRGVALLCAALKARKETDR